MTLAIPQPALEHATMIRKVMHIVRRRELPNGDATTSYYDGYVTGLADALGLTREQVLDQMDEFERQNPNT
jgi:hypothetical protein